MMTELAAMVEAGELRCKHRTWYLPQWREAFEAAAAPYTGTKEIFLFS